MKIIGKETLYTTKYLNFDATHFLNKDNVEDIWYSANRGNDGKTVLVAAILDDKLVVTKEFRVPVGGEEWGLPAGLVDDDELPENAAKRELKEETNLDLISVIEVTPWLYNTAGMTNEKVSIVYCKASGSVHNLGTENTEEIECFLMTRYEVEQLIRNKDFHFSAKAYLIFKKFIESGKW